MTLRMRLFLAAWSTLWTIGSPIVLAYLLWRSRKDRLYGRHLRERFGHHDPGISDCVWIHAVSLGELRSAVPLVHAFLDRGERVVISTFTPAGRREADRVFAGAIADGTVRPTWVPIETERAYRRFFDRFRPKFGLVMEIEIWPRMVFAARAAGIPLFMCNAQYPRKSIARDSRGLRLRQEVMRGFAGAFVKSDVQARRFAAVGVTNIAVTGELRFEQPVPPELLAAGHRVRLQPVLGGCRIISFVSAVEGEEEVYIPAMRALMAAGKPVFFIYVPRRPEQFDRVAVLLENAGFSLLRRSTALPAALDGTAVFSTANDLPDLLLGDSLGETYFYLSMADVVVVGGGFTPRGAHNIIEPLMLGKPVITGPETGTTEYPFAEAESAGVVQRVTSAHELAAALRVDMKPDPARIGEFLRAHSGAVERLLAALPGALDVAQR